MTRLPSNNMSQYATYGGNNDAMMESAFMDDEYSDELMSAAAGMGRGGGAATVQATMEMYAKKLIHQDFYNDFTDDCDDTDLS